MSLIPSVLAAAPAILETVNEFFPKTSSSSQSHATAQENHEGMSSPKHAVSHPVLHSGLPVNPISPRQQQPSSGLIVPFQTHVHRYNGVAKIITMPVANVSHIMAQMQMAQVAEVVELEIVINPTYQAYRYAATITAAWTPDHMTPDQYNLGSIYGAQTFTFGGTYHIGGFTIPCDLSTVNPVIKSPVNFNNGPRYTISCFNNHEAVKDNINSLAEIYLRGKIRLSVPALTFGASMPI